MELFKNSDGVWFSDKIPAEKVFLKRHFYQSHFPAYLLFKYAILHKTLVSGIDDQIVLRKNKD